MHGSSVSGGDIVHASRYAEAFHVATRVAAAAGGESVDPSMHGSSAADDVSSRNTNAAHVATRALHRSDVGDGSSAGASSISFGDDGSRHRHIGAAQVATGGWAMTSPSEGSIHSSISFGASAHNGRYSLATRVASGVFAAAAAADSSVGGSSISFGDDISARRLSPRGGSVAARAAHTSPGVEFNRSMHGPGHSSHGRSRSVHAIINRSNSWRTRFRRTGSMHATSLPASSMHDCSRRSHKSTVRSLTASSYAQSVAAGVLASVSGSESATGASDPRQRSRGPPGTAASGLSAAADRVDKQQQKRELQHQQLRDSHRSIARNGSTPLYSQEENRIHSLVPRSNGADQLLSGTSLSPAALPASADESQFPDAVELHSPGLDDFDAEVVSSELVFAPRFPEGPTIVHVPSPELQARCVEGSSESASPPYQSPTQLSAEKLWHSDVDSQSQSQSFHSFSTRTNSTARAAVESSSFSFLSQGTVGKDTLWDPPSGGGTTHAWGASAPAVVCQSRDASHNGGRSEPGSTGQSGFPISATVRAHDGWRPVSYTHLTLPTKA